MTFFGKALCATALVVFSTTSLASPLSDSESQLMFPLESQEIFSDSPKNQKSGKTLFDATESELSNTDAAFGEGEAADNSIFFSDQNIDNQSLIINVSE